jgi:predicted esterase
VSPHNDREAPLVGPPPERLTLPGMPGAWFYRPSRSGRQRVLVYLHARNANPRESCQRWHESTPRFGWLLCPIGPVDRGGGRREWRNNADYARRESIASLEALLARFPRRVRRHDNVIMGFSEGAFAAMNVGLAEPETFTRWLILAANDGYIDGEEERITRAASTVQRVYLLTGEHDGIVDRTRRAHDVLRRAFGRRRIRMRILSAAGHELPPDFRRTTRPILLWVTQ